MKKILFPIILFIFSCTKVTEKIQSNNFSEAKQTTQPNILLILADDVGYENLTCNGGQSYSTPNLDLFAAQNTRYTQCHSCPTCSPSRQELMTGKYNFRNYVEFGVMPTNQKTFANMLKDAGYKTCIAGKWQLDGGASSATAFGFDEFWLYNAFDEHGAGSRYKSPHIYLKDGSYIPNTTGKYGEDIFADSLISFMANANGQPFLAYWTMTLCHMPFCPTPDDPEFATWTGINTSDTKFYPSMMKYMDKKVGYVLHALDSLGLTDNTIVIFVGDNGTPSQIYSLYNGSLVRGGKHLTIETGTHVPMIVKGFGTGVDNRLIDFTDFLPTLAEIAGIPVPTDYGILDGHSFLSYTRDWVFCDYTSSKFLDTAYQSRWVQNTTYKLYDIAEPDMRTGQLFNFSLHPLEPVGWRILHPTTDEQTIKNNFQTVLNSMHN